MLRLLEQQADGVLVVDAGDDLTGPGILPQQRDLRARLILDSYRRMDVAAMALGELDRAAHVDLDALPRRTMVTRAGIQIGVFTLDLDAAGAAAQLAQESAGARASGARLVVALLHGGIEKARPLIAAGKSGVDVAVVSHDGYSPGQPVNVGGAWMVESNAKGKVLGVLDLHVVDGRMQFEMGAQRGRLEEQLRSQERELAGLEVRAREADKLEMRDYFQRTRRGIAERMAAERRELQAMSARTDGSWLASRDVSLGSEIPDDPAIASLVRKYKEEVARQPVVPAEPAASIPGGAAAMAAMATSGVATAAASYAGIDQCKSCHAPAFAFWRKTKHAKAWDALVKKGQDRDPACISCHVTGGLAAITPSRPGAAPAAVAVNRSLVNVQCESCHGAGREHAERTGARGLVQRSTTESLCRTCHTPQQTTEWDYPAFLAAVLGPGHGRR